MVWQLQTTQSLIEPSASASDSPNAVRCLSCVGTNAPLGTLSIRRRFTNNSNQTLTKLRFRVNDITTLNSPGYAPGNSQADLRLINSSDNTVAPQTSIGVAMVKGTTLDEPPNQPNGGGLNSSVSVMLPGEGLPPGQSIDVQFLLGVVQWGTYRFSVSPEAFPLPPVSYEPTPTPTPTPTPAPVNSPALLTEENSNRAIALDSVSWLRDPLSVLEQNKFSQDGHTRVLLFARNAQLQPGEDYSVMTAQAEDAAGRIYPLTVEYVGRVSQFDWLSQITVRLPDDLANAGDVRMSISLRGAVSNKVLVKLRP